MRDRRFIAKHRGGPLEKESHRLLAAWAADCAARLLPMFEKYSSDERPVRAVEVGCAWSKGEVTVGQAQKAAVAAHAAARAVAGHPAACAVARACGHAVATAHMAEHSLGVVIYGMKAIEACGGSVEAEFACQMAKLPADMQALVTSALSKRLPPSHARQLSLIPKP